MGVLIVGYVFVFILFLSTMFKAAVDYIAQIVYFWPLSPTLTRTRLPLQPPLFLRKLYDYRIDKKTFVLCAHPGDIFSVDHPS